MILYQKAFLKLLLFNVLIFSNLLSQSNFNSCGTNKKLAALLNDKEFEQKFWENRQRIINNNKKNNSNILNRSTVYTIPVVFHVLHNGGDENISRAQLLDAIDVLNRDYRKLNPDISTVNSIFQDITADIEIEFKLATKAPNGVCFNGITRTQSVESFSGDGWSQVDAIRNGNDVFQGEWPGDQYLNFFVCGNVGEGVAGYTYFPGSVGNNMENGVWVLNNYVGRFGTSSEGNSRVLTHEIGHWLDLPHTWGYTNEPGLPDNCLSDDDIQDTPNTIGSTWCNLNENTCGEIANVENYMDYAYCSKMFTLGQKERMRAAITSDIDNRINLWSSSNLINTGAFEEPYLCKAMFSQSTNTICEGESVQFTDLSYNKAISWNWTFEGANPSTSSEQNPLVTYYNAGNFSVKLIVSDGTNTDTAYFSNSVSVNNPSLNLPFSDNFETYTLLSLQNKWKVNNFQMNNFFEITNQASFSSSNSVFLNNYYEFENSVDELISPNINLSSVDTMVTLSFFFAYQKRPDINNEKLQIYVSKDCGKTWNLRKTISGTLLYSIENENSYIPSNKEEWQLVHVTGINQSDWSSNFMFKFKFTGQGGNNIFIDDVNLYEGPPNENLSYLDIIENDKNKIFKIYPNPANELLILKSTEQIGEYKIEIFNIDGEKISFNKKDSNDKSILIDTRNFSSGLYFISFENSKSKQLKKFIVN